MRRLTLLGLPALAGPLAAILLQCPYAEAQSARITRDAVAARIAKAPRIHPRLFLGRGAEAALKQKIAGDPLLARAVARLTVEADGILPAAPVEHKKIGRRLLDQSRRCLARMTRLTLAYRLTGERKYLDRARTEMLAAAAFSDWNPSHFLDVAEMTAALAIGYDWLYEDLDAETRAAIRAAIVEKGLKPSLEVQGGWVTGTNNWNQVCHGGMTLGALAVLEDEPELAADIIARAIDGLPHAMAEYAPDGAGSEGPGYWAYGTSYNVVLINALESVLGMDFGLSQAEGFLKTADYYLHAAGPTGLFFNYSDCAALAGVSPAMYWFAARRGEPSLVWNEEQKLAALVSKPPSGDGDRLLPLLILWRASSARPPAPDALSWMGRGTTPVAFHRSGWDQAATFVAIKGGSASANHAHMDSGSFVMDADGVRWAEDLGMQDYNSLESIGLKLWERQQDAERWTVFRLSTYSHNTLVVNGQQQRVAGTSPIVGFSADGPSPHTVVDLSPVYGGQLARALRGVALRPDRTVLVQDEIQAPATRTSVRWGMVTRAEVETRDDGTAVLARDGKACRLAVLEPTAARLAVLPLDPPPAKYDAPNPGAKMIVFEVTLDPSATARLVVHLTPGGTTGAPVVFRPLSAW